MYPHQADRLAQALASEGASALVGTTPANVFYVAGFASLVQRVYGNEVYAVYTSAGTGLVVPAIDAATVAGAAAAVDVVRCYGDFVFARGAAPGDVGRRIDEWTARPATSAADALADVLDALGARTGAVRLDETGLTPPAWTRAIERLAPRVIRPGAAAFAGARMIKGPYEIECLGRALGIAEEAVNEVIQVLQPGVTEREAARIYDTAVLARGGEPYITTILMGERAAFPAAAQSESALRKGDLVRFDLGAVWKGYRSDLGRTAVMGEPDARQDTALAATQAGLEAALEAAAPGSSAADVFEKAIAATRAAGLPHFGRHHVGYGIGLEARESPVLGPGDTTALAAGMVLRVETPYYEPGWGGLHLKDTILVTRNGRRVMNRSHRGLVVLD
ncbi:MAG: aminopeptidase P family protein [Candidatus Rokubacteria bacterium]|nr:aminopeptidase P family protein [Candidatus Rokubacteria bacterium]